MFRQLIVSLGITLLCAPSALAETITLDDVVRLLEAGIGERVVIAQIEESGTRFDLSTSEILELRESGVPESVIEAIIRSGGQAHDNAPLTGTEGDVETELEVEVDEAVPAEIGFSRYDDNRSVEVTLVPYAVPRYVYSYDPWAWDYFWYDPYYYVSVSWNSPYRYWSWCHPSWSPGFYVSWHYGHSYWGHGHHHDHYGSHHDSRSVSVHRPSYVKGTYRTRDTSTRVAAKPPSSRQAVSNRYADRGASRRVVSDGTTRGSTSGRKSYRGTAPSTSRSRSVSDRSVERRNPERSSSGGGKAYRTRGTTTSRAPAVSGSRQSTSRDRGGAKGSGTKSRRSGRKDSR